MAKSKKLFPKSVLQYKSINTYRMNITDFTEQHFIEAISIDGLSDLALNNTNFNPEHLALLKECSSLSKLSISSSSANFEIKFLSGINNLPIVELRLSYLGITDDQLADFPKLSKLERLYLDGNLITGRGLAHVVLNAPNIEVISLCPDTVARRAESYKDLLVFNELAETLPNFKKLAGLWVNRDNTELIDSLKKIGGFEVFEG